MENTREIRRGRTRDKQRFILEEQVVIRIQTWSEVEDKRKSEGERPKGNLLREVQMKSTQSTQRGLEEIYMVYLERFRGNLHSLHRKD